MLTLRNCVAEASPKTSFPQTVTVIETSLVMGPPAFIVRVVLTVKVPLKGVTF